MEPKEAFLLSVLVLTVCSISADVICPPVRGEPSCVCQSSKGKIDLTPLANHPHQGPRFLKLKGNFDTYYSYNPCYGYTIKDTNCTNASACQDLEGTLNTKQITIANSSTETMYEMPNGSVYLKYSYPLESQGSTAVYLHCNSSSLVTTEGRIENTFIQFRFDVYSPHACPSTSGVAVGIVGLVLMILLLVAVVAYCAVGAVFQSVKYQAKGSDLVPHKQFWLTLLALTMDGCRFTFSSCRTRLIRRNEYENLD